jgi:hypothetical protein
MADDHIQRPPEQVAPGPPRAVVDGRLPAATAQSSAASPLPAGSGPGEGILLLRWLVGVMIVLVCGWALIIVAVWIGHSFPEALAMDVAGAIAAVLSLGLFLTLERNLWLSRFMGLRIGPTTSPLTEAVMLWLLGVPGLFFRSTVGPQYAPTRDTPRPLQETDSFREVVETVVFVVVLVLLLKSFLAEAFVIPTGSMAPTLLGYHRHITCPQCGVQFDVNASKEVDAQEGELQPVTGCTCPNCQFHIELRPRNVEGMLQP